MPPENLPVEVLAAWVDQAVGEAAIAVPIPVQDQGQGQADRGLLLMEFTLEATLLLELAVIFLPNKNLRAEYTATRFSCRSWVARVEGERPVSLWVAQVEVERF